MFDKIFNRFSQFTKFMKTWAHNCPHSPRGPSYKTTNLQTNSSGQPLLSQQQRKTTFREAPVLSSSWPDPCCGHVTHNCIRQTKRAIAHRTKMNSFSIFSPRPTPLGKAEQAMFLLFLCRAPAAIIEESLAQIRLSSLFRGRTDGDTHLSQQALCQVRVLFFFVLYRSVAREGLLGLDNALQQQQRRAQISGFRAWFSEIKPLGRLGRF